jgi:SAM-dependent methyltransferase
MNVKGFVDKAQRSFGPRIEALISSQYYLRRWRQYAPYLPDEPRLWRYERRLHDDSPVREWDPAVDGIPGRSLWTGYGNSAEEYLASGRRDAATMRDMLVAAGRVPGEGESVLDFGCHAGRMLRWLPTDEGVSYWGVDTNSAMVRFCADNFPSPPFRFAVTTELPHLPFRDGEFSLVIAGSVFTHIDDLTLAWFLELRRVLPAGGQLYVTIHDESTVRLLRRPDADSWLANYLRVLRTFHKSSLERSVMFTVGRGRDSQVFHRREWLTGLLSGLFELEAVREGAYGCFKDPYQTGLLLRRV